MNKITMFVICLFTAIKTFMCISAGAEAPKSIVTVDGRFYASMEMSDIDGNKDIYYQFRSDDNTVWWLLTANDIGFVPQTLENLSANIITGGKIIDHGNLFEKVRLECYKN